MSCSIKIIIVGGRNLLAGSSDTGLVIGVVGAEAGLVLNSVISLDNSRYAR